MAIQINCPNCLKTYSVAENHVGRKVTCANTSCRCDFVVTKPMTDEVVFDEAVVEFNGDSESVDSAMPHSINAITPSKANSRTESRALQNCQFRSLGRVLVFTGLAMMLTATICPNTLRHSEGAGFRSMHNLPLAGDKLNALVLGLALSVTGAVFWSSTQTSLSQSDAVAVYCLVGAMVIVTAWQIVGPILSMYAVYS